ncbi:MAG TPA: hypothetical protein VJM31_16390 [Vicinamibacterales bacterium]|nr:hypothetical protein [Vicinamibacterales bacterium]
MVLAPADQGAPRNGTPFAHQGEVCLRADPAQVAHCVDAFVTIKRGGIGGLNVTRPGIS